MCTITLLFPVSASQQTSERSLSPQPSTSSDHSGSNVQTNHQPNVPVTPTSSPPSEPQQASEVTLRWESYCSKMQSYFPHLLKNGQFADVTLAADDQFINCHKVHYIISKHYICLNTLYVPCF